MLSGFSDKTNIRRPKECGEYNNEVAAKKLRISFCGVLKLTRCDYCGPQRKDAEKSNVRNYIDKKLVCQC